MRNPSSYPQPLLGAWAWAGFALNTVMGLTVDVSAWVTTGVVVAVVAVGVRINALLSLLSCPLHF